MPLVTVIMPVYNAERFLAEAIDSILSQTFSDFELLIVDDGSQDGSAEIIHALETGDDRIRAFRNEKNLGHADARNRGLDEARGSFVTFLDSDDTCLRQRLENQIGFLQTNPDVGAVGTCARVVNHDCSATLFDFIVPEEHALIALNLFFGASFVGASVMFRRKLLRDVGGFESGKRVNPDLEMSLRLLWRSSTKFANLPEILYVYRRHDQALTVGHNAAAHVEERELRRRMLERLWHQVSECSLDRFQALRRQEKLNWKERRAAKIDLLRLVESLIAHNLVSADDHDLMVAAVNRRLEQASPRWWQQFCHWRRRRLPWLHPD